MPGHADRTLFERALLASKLVDAAELVEATSDLAQDGRFVGGAADDRLAQRLINRGLLNRWQVDQLSAGRTKFTLGPYLIIDAVGKGGMGHVFKGRHELLGRTEAIKVLPKSRSNPRSIANFQHEIRAQAQLDHPNLVRVSFADKDGDTYFFVTEFVPGVDLRRLVRRRGALEPDQAAEGVSQVASALAYAHRRGLVHRDVKPGNLLIRPDGLVKVTDLGLAWFLGDTFGAAPTGSGKVVGTCDYLAPEAILQPDRIVPVSDIYSLGCTLYYAVTGKVPFPGGNSAEKLRRQKHDAPIDPRAFNPDLPEGLADLIAQMMAKDHHERTPSAEAAIERLRPFIREDSREGLAEVVKGFEPTPPVRSSSRVIGEGPAIGSGLDETLDSITSDGLPVEGPPESHANSQASQGTDPVSKATEDTIAGDRAPVEQAAQRRGMDTPLVATAVIALVALAIMAAAVLQNF